MKMKKWSYVLLAGALLVMPIETQASKKFSDVPSNHYASEAIQWAEKKAIVSGDNGKFNPSKEVTEMQFVKMYAEFFGHVLVSTPENEFLNWSSVYYDGLARYNVPLKGANIEAARKQPITRGEVAQLIAFAHGKPSDVESAVRYMMETGISTGQNKAATSILEKYGAANTLTRAQAVAFLYRVNSISGNTLVSKRIDEDKVEELAVVTKPEPKPVELIEKERDEEREVVVKNEPVKTGKPKALAEEETVFEERDSVGKQPETAKIESQYLNENVIQSYYLGGTVNGQLIADGANDFELKFTIADREIVGGYIGGLGQSLEGITVGASYSGDVVTEQNGKSIQVLVDKFEGGKVLGIYWYYTYPAAKDAMREMEKDTSAQKQNDEEKLYVELVNLTRVHHTLPTVAINDIVMRVARDHSTDMYENNYFSHTSLNQDSPVHRLAAAGLTEYRTWGENISKGYVTTFHAHNGWMNSEGHRHNILNEAFKEIGFGVNNRLYTTVFFTSRD